jgi:hypothetical protein
MWLACSLARALAGSILLVLYLDTNHLSRLARHPAEPECRTVRDMLAAQPIHLGITFVHLQELSSPDFKSRAAVGELLDSVRVAWGPSPDDVFEREVRSAIRLAMTGIADASPVFHADFVRAFGAPRDADIPISEMLEAMAGHPTLRTHLPEAAEYGMAADQQFGRTAAVVRDPREPILAHIRELNTDVTPEGLRLPRAFSAEEILERAGGPAGFPATNVSHSLARLRLNDDSFAPSKNDVLDEWHACYLPYCGAMVLDRRTTARVRMTHVPDVARVTHRLADVPDLLATG